MIKAIVILIILSFNFSACEKTEIKKDLAGTWTIFGTGGGVGGQGNTFNFNTLNLRRSGDYKFVRNDTIIDKGSFEISKNLDSRWSGIGDFIIDFNSKFILGSGANMLSNNSFIIQEISNDTIGFCEMFADGFSYYFKRLD